MKIVVAGTGSIGISAFQPLELLPEEMFSGFALKSKTKANLDTQ